MFRRYRLTYESIWQRIQGDRTRAATLRGTVLPSKERFVAILLPFATIFSGIFPIACGTNANSETRTRSNNENCSEDRRRLSSVVGGSPSVGMIS